MTGPLLVAAVVITSACTSDAPTEGEDKASQLADSVDATDKQLEGIDHAIELVVRRCMEDRGFEVHTPIGSYSDGEMYGTPEFSEPKPPTMAEAQERGFGYGVEFGPENGGESEVGTANDQEDDSAWYDLTIEEQTEYGEILTYGHFFDRDEFGLEELKEKYFPDGDAPDHFGWGLIPDEIAELRESTGETYTFPDGTETKFFPESCRFWAEEQVTGDPYLYHEYQHTTVFGLQTSVFEDAMQREEPVAARGAWAACMADAGYEHLTEASDLWHELYAVIWHDELDRDDPAQTEAAHESERALAIAHASCEEETGFWQAKSDAWDAALADYLVEHEDEVYAWFDFVEAAEERAAELLAS
ncbi:hypothetical protein [Natronoglycomyces albus]|uniref:Uncharacterized protein n=1 Tax=Natronoglycomyces albus TaxID=2811108 RepID=A0A895XL81_9ACTN|nr:hypothetical protein [Natronoglycomyces albus]QSB04179.1 hypothetical protein JQS30_10175 [Natronoglycomyces albus]